MKLKGKVAIVTGATSGIGEAVAIAYAKEGALQTLTGRDAGRLGEIEKRVRQAGSDCLCIQADLSRVSDVRKVVQGTVERFGRIDILFNSAGVAEFTPFMQVTEEVYDRVMDTNVKSQFFLCQMVVPEMKKIGKGKIICMASVAGVIGIPGMIAYCGSKAAILNMVKALSVELAPFKINVNAISPGNILSPMNEAKFKDPAFLEANLAITPLRRIGNTGDITPAAIYLACEDSDFMTGSHMLIDGGMAAP
jgi:glucose 1-dehydrogenase